MEIIKKVYEKKLPGCQEAITLISEPIRKTSTSNYQQKWKAFISFIGSINVPFEKVTFSTVIKFLTHLFYEKSLRPSTVAHYRSALSLPLKLHLDIDLRLPEVNQLLRAMALQRPKSTVTAPSWKLSTVLDFLETETNLNTEIMKMRKAAFLILLATGWRISELHACVRDEDLCRFTETSSLLIRPHPSFLAKNELRKRMSFREIKSLTTDSGTTSKLCPVTALKDYLKSTDKEKAGKLFLSPTNHEKTLSIAQLSSHVKALIRMADPENKAKVKDVRKFAASYSFAETMIIGDLVSSLNWSSSAVFYKYYFTQTETLSRPVSLPI